MTSEETLRAPNSREYDQICVNVRRNVLPLGKHLGLSAMVSPSASGQFIAELVKELRCEMDEKEAQYYAQEGKG